MEKSSSKKLIQKALLQFLKEDIGPGDITTDAIVLEDLHFIGEFIAKENGIIAGLSIIKSLFLLIDKKIVLKRKVEDGQFIQKGQIIAIIEGPGAGILKGERTALNLLQRMSGIASLTRQFVGEISGTNAVILDTRKTAPGLRLFDKWAVHIGGGKNHRFGLFDMILIKENHITTAGSITNAIQRVRERYQTRYPLEVEVKNTAELEEALKLKPDRILLDNMTIAELSEAVRINKGRIPLEASGNVSLDNVKEIAKTGVDYISVGKLTHSAKAMDISLILK
jgi:nicotinate-nucleotide pyrophosphorylase (carboxylating)